MGDITFYLDTANSLLVLLTGLIGLIGTGVSTYFAVKNWIANTKTKKSQEIWVMLMEMADTAMTEAEKNYSTSTDKKEFVLNTIAASAKAAGLDIDEFMSQLDDYIDQTIKFVNKMKKNSNKQ